MTRLLHVAAALLVGGVVASDRILGFEASPVAETRSLDEIYEAAKKEGGAVTLWHGGDEEHMVDFIKQEFETRFPDLKLNLTVDLSKYHSSRIDEQLAKSSVYVDSVILQTLHDYPRWAQQGALLNYAPQGFDQIHSGFKDTTSASYYGLEIFYWTNVWNPQRLPNADFDTFDEYLKPEYKDKLVFTYPNDDDAILFAFNLVMQRKGTAWFDALLAQNPRWVRGTNTPLTLVQRDNETVSATFGVYTPLSGAKGVNNSFPTDADFVSWPQMGAILKDAPHPESAKLLHNFMLSPDFQKKLGWSVRMDMDAPEGFRKIMDTNHTNPLAFASFMADRVTVERLRFWFESRLGTAQGESPLTDAIVPPQ
ncbi:hypothetical protein CDD83_8002 [Cordyceps sp. RAO-2017]|nr:hypothetical protein CDD83_8002 [Cordyceps sp. RAO-2017]